MQKILTNMTYNKPLQCARNNNKSAETTNFPHNKLTHILML